MRIGLIDTVTSKRAKSGASMALDLMFIPARSMTLDEGEVDRFREWHRWLRYRANRANLEDRPLDNGALYKAHHLEKSSTDVRFGYRDDHPYSGTGIPCLNRRARSSAAGSVHASSACSVLTSRHQVIYVLMHEN